MSDAEADDAQASDAARLMVCVVPPLHSERETAGQNGPVVEKILGVKL